ncbi:glycosyltransferase 87 family protein [Nocardioides sp. BYT-33-1]|uniref:glycosyltransferase 87 family protein n=1 Tax=Nocardioides sp. BYT-33-1 TaxID=3416952 RepID=UPI003F52DE9A
MDRVRRGAGPAGVLVAVLAGAIAGAIAGAMAGAMAGGFPDLHVYRYGGDAVLHQARLYDADDPVTGYPFTYPPFAALVMVPLALLPSSLAATVWTGASTAALVAGIAVVLRARGTPTSPWLVVLLAAVALALEPVWQTLAFGQVNLLLMLALLADLLGPWRRWSGVLVGIVAGIKLTPLVFVVLLVLTGQRAAAIRAGAAFGLTVVAGFLALPDSAAAYWSDGLLDARRVGPPALAHNQSLHGALTRLLGEPVPIWLWLAVAAPAALAVLGVAARWWPRDRLLAIGLAAVAMLVASPVSWSHHWVWAVPIALALGERSRPAAVAWTAVFVARPIVWPPWAAGREYDWRWFEHLPGDAYLLAALTVAVGAALALNRRPRDAVPLHGRCG